MVTVSGWVFVTLLGSFVMKVEGYTSGAPREACRDLMPGHGVEPRKKEDIQYEIQVGSDTFSPGVDLEITLSGTGWLTKSQFKGFILQVRDMESHEVLGTFDVSQTEMAQYLQCSKIQDTVTHKNSQDKSSVSVLWKSPAKLNSKQVYVAATVVQDYNDYWVDFRSPPLDLVRRPEPEPETEPESEPEPKSEPEPQSIANHNSEHEDDIHEENEPESQSHLEEKKHHLYDGCSVKKACFGLPSDCLILGNCDLVVSWMKETEDNMVMELLSREGRGRYAAVGLSDDQNMGEDLVMSCADSGDGRLPRVELSWNKGRSNQMIQKDAGFELLEGRLQDGKYLYCKFRRPNWIVGYPAQAGSKQFIYELDKKHYHLLLAGGPYSTEGGLSYHGAGMAQATAEKVDLTKVDGVEVASDILIKVHGVLMVVAWMGCAGSGIILARYFKDTWKNSACGGKAIWFQWHRLLMMITWSATIAGLACIVMEVGGWPYDQRFIMKNPHPVLGVAALVLTFLQPFIALCRPHPDSSSRWVFNWTHWFVGNSAHVIAIITMFFAIELEKSGLEPIVTWILVGWVTFHVGSHLIFSLNICWAEQNPHDRSEIYPISGRDSSTSNFLDSVYLTKDKRGGTCRKFCFGLYFVVTWALTGLVVCLIFVKTEQIDIHLGHKH